MRFYMRCISYSLTPYILFIIKAATATVLTTKQRTLDSIMRCVINEEAGGGDILYL